MEQRGRRLRRTRGSAGRLGCLAVHEGPPRTELVRDTGGRAGVLLDGLRDPSLYMVFDEKATRGLKDDVQSVPPLSLVRLSAMTSQRMFAFSAFHSI